MIAMMSTGVWVKVVGSGRANGVRMLHTDTRGRPVVRFDKEWWTVDRLRRNICKVTGKA